MKIKYYFINLWRALRGQTGFRLVNSDPNTWYRLTEMTAGTSKNICFGYIKTNEAACFIPFIQVGEEFTWSKPE